MQSGGEGANCVGPQRSSRATGAVLGTGGRRDTARCIPVARSEDPPIMAGWPGMGTDWYGQPVSRCSLGAAARVGALLVLLTWPRPIAAVGGRGADGKVLVSAPASQALCEATALVVIHSAIPVADFDVCEQVESYVVALGRWCLVVVTAAPRPASQTERGARARGRGSIAAAPVGCRILTSVQHIASYTSSSNKRKIE